MGADWGTGEEDSQSLTKSGSDSESKHSKAKKKKRRSRKKSSGRSSTESERSRSGHKDKKTPKKTKDKKKKKKQELLDRDKGPFGVGETSRLPKTRRMSEERGSSSTGSSQSFQRAPSGLTLHLRLQRYAQRFPGRLATRLLEKMERATRLEGAIQSAGKTRTRARPCALLPDDPVANSQGSMERKD